MVADRGMISAETIAELERRDWPYILGARMRRQKEVAEEVLARAGRYRIVRELPAGKEGPTDTESGSNTARATLGSGLAVSAFPLYVPG